jgi:hypothetical protein
MSSMPIDFNNFNHDDFEGKQSLINFLVSSQIKQLERKLAQSLKIQNEQIEANKRAIEEQRIISNERYLEQSEKLEDNKKDTQELKQIVETKIKNDNYNFMLFNTDYLSLRAIGNLHIPHLSAQVMGNLLRVCGLAKISTHTMPYETSFKGGEPLVKESFDQGSNWRIRYLWHKTKIWDLIRKELKELNLLNEFESFTADGSESLKKWINDLHDYKFPQIKKRKEGL